jgi:hypothetical protein
MLYLMAVKPWRHAMMHLISLVAQSGCTIVGNEGQSLNQAAEPMKQSAHPTKSRKTSREISLEA